MELSNYRYEEIKESVAKTLELGQIKKTTYMSLYSANSLNISQIPYTSLSRNKMEACFELSEEGFTLDDTIYYNDLMYEKRTRFTIMHEIGHIMLDHNCESEITEKEANFFAKYILAPHMLILANDRTFDMDEFKIRKLFNVSDEISKYIYSSYKKWIGQLNGFVPNTNYDKTIFNLFYNPSSM